MAWPSGTKASTANVDAGTDSITSARADIKQNFDNVNDIIDHLNISSPSDGDLLQYSTSSGKWEQVASSSVGTTTSVAILDIDFLPYNTTSGTYKALFTEEFDPNNIVTIDTFDSANQSEYFTLGSGTYILEFKGLFASARYTSQTLYNITDATTVSDITSGTGGSIRNASAQNVGLSYGRTVGLTIGASKDLEISYSFASAGDDAGGNIQIVITKIG